MTFWLSTELITRLWRPSWTRMWAHLLITGLRPIVSTSESRFLSRPPPPSVMHRGSRRCTINAFIKIFCNFGYSSSNCITPRPKRISGKVDRQNRFPMQGKRNFWVNLICLEPLLFKGLNHCFTNIDFRRAFLWRPMQMCTMRTMIVIGSAQKTIKRSTPL